MDSMLNMVQMMSMLQTMQASSDDSENPGKEDGRGGMSDLLKGMLTPEQQTMFDSINTMFPGGENSDSQNKEE